MNKFLLICFLLLISKIGFSQPIDSCLYVQFDLANRWVWRGVSYSEAPVVQPILGYSNNKLNALINGSFPLERRAYSEIDFTLEYLVHPQIKIGFTDYFGINDSLGARHAFLNFKRETTMHMFDVFTLIYPIKEVPLSLLGSFWFWGADREHGSLKQNLSTYFELKFEKEFGPTNTYVFIGGTPMKGFYAHRPAIVNMGIGLSKSLFAKTKISIPAKIEFVLNPELQNAYINAIISLK